MKFILLTAVFSLFLLSPAFAVGNLTVTGRGMVPSGNFTNSITSIALLNLSLSVTEETDNKTVIISLLNVSLGNGTTAGNVSAVELYLSNDTRVIGSATISMNSTAFNVSIPNTLVVNSSNITNLIVRFNISRNATTRQLLSALIVSASDVGVNTGSNVTISGTTQSNATQLQSFHANASISPNFVDTSAINQTIWYIITPTGRDAIKNITITIPSGYNLTNVSTVEISSSNSSAFSSYTTAPNYINVSITNPTTDRVKVTFNVNTSNTRVNASAFTSTIDGGNLTNVTTDIVGTGINVTTQQLVNVTNVALAKGAAIVNGTDYWEFNFTLGFTANVTGILQFKMSDWTDASSSVNRLNINTSSVYYTTLRTNANNFSDNNGKFNVTNSYIENTGLNRTITDSSTLSLILRMIIPLGTPISNSWASTYGFLFMPTS